MVFPGVKVKRSGTSSFNYKWSYNNPVFWFYNTFYRFSAINVDSVHGQPITAIQGLNADSYGYFDWTQDVSAGKHDIVWATQTQQTENATTLSQTPGTVKLTFNHPLSRIMFRWDVDMPENYDIEITDVTLGGTVKAGRCSLAGQPVKGAWPNPDTQPTAIWDAPEGTSGFESCVLDYGTTLKQDNKIYSRWRYVIPADVGKTRVTDGVGMVQLKPKFKAVVYHYGVKQGEFWYDPSVAGTAAARAWGTVWQGIMQGYSYLWTFTLDKFSVDPANMLYDIKFAVDMIAYKGAPAIQFDVSGVTGFTPDEDI